MASAFLEALIAIVPNKIYTVLTDNGAQFRYAPRSADGPTARFATHMFDMRCREHGIEHRFSPNQSSMDPWTGRTHEPDHQGSQRQMLPLRKP